MNLRNLSIVTGILAVIAIAILAFEHATKPQPGTVLPSGDSTLLTDERMAPAATIIVKGSDKKETRIVTDKKGHWMVENHHNLPVDFSKLSRLLGGIRDAGILRFVTRNPEKASQLEIDQSSVTLLDDKGEVIRKIRFGKTGKNQGTFVALDDQPEVYLSSFNGFVDGDPSSWANKQLIDAQPADVRKASIRWNASEASSESMTVQREKAGDPFTIEGAPEGNTLNEDTLENALHSLLSARYTSVEPASDPMPQVLVSPIEITVSLFDDRSYVFTVGRKPEPPQAAEPEQPETTKPPQPAWMHIVSASSDDPINSWMQNLAFQYGAWLIDNFPQSPDKLLNPVETPGIGNQEATEANEDTAEPTVKPSDPEASRSEDSPKPAEPEEADANTESGDVDQSADPSSTEGSPSA